MKTLCIAHIQHLLFKDSLARMYSVKKLFSIFYITSINSVHHWNTVSPLQSMPSKDRCTAKMPPVTSCRDRNICSQDQYFITDCGAFWHSNVKKKKKKPYRHRPQGLTHIQYWHSCSDREKWLLRLFCQRLAWPNPTNWVTVCTHFISNDLQIRCRQMAHYERANQGESH